MIQAILARFGRIDFAHCNAGICINAPADEMTFEQWKKVIDVNLTGVFLTAQAAGKVMLKQGGGSIINTASSRDTLSTCLNRSAPTTPPRPASSC